MKMLVTAALAASMAVGSVVAASGHDILIFGDSTGKGDGAQRRWHQRMLETLPHDLVIENFSRSRSSIGKILDALEANQSKLSGTVIIYDRRNAGETADSYIAELHRAADLIGHSRFLILPQVPVSGGREDRLTLEILVAINERLLTEFAANTFDAATQSAFIADLAGDKTRSDHIHRNDVGQQIEADYISTWLSRASYREPALRTLAVHHANGETGFGYEFAWVPGFENGRLGAAHGFDEPFAFGQLDRIPLAQGDDGAVRLVGEMSRALLGFAREGKPGWAEHTAEQRHKVFA